VSRNFGHRRRDDDDMRPIDMSAASLYVIFAILILVLWVTCIRP
jgi:hypothetical protein